MIEKVGPIKNPLTIIAIFAAIAEISGTVVLPFISDVNQGVYVWFLIIFPIALISFFFLTLNFNHKVLYAPSDYVNEENFILSLPRGSALEKSFKLNKEITDLESGFSFNEKASNDVGDATPNASSEEKNPARDSKDEASLNVNLAEAATSEPVAVEIVKKARSDDSLILQDLSSLKNIDEIDEKRLHGVIARVRYAEEEKRRHYLLLEKLAVDKVAKDFPGDLQRDIKIGPNGALVDGVVAVGNEVRILEVAVVKNTNFNLSTIVDSLRAIHSSAQTFFGKEIAYKIILILVFEEGMDKALLPMKISTLQAMVGFPIELRLFAKDGLVGRLAAAAT